MGVGKRRYPPELIVLPVGTVVVLGLGAFLAGASPTIRYARVYGGPTDVYSWNGRVELWEEADQSAHVVPGAKLELVRSGKDAELTATKLVVTASDGVSDFSLGHANLGPHLLVREPGTLGVLAEGEPNFPRKVWEASATSRGGRAARDSTGPVRFQVEVHPVVLSVPFRGELRVKAGPEVALRFEFEGIAPLGPLPTHTLDQEVVVPFRAEEHAASLRVVGTTEAGEGTWFSSLPVVPGSFALERTDAGLLVRSPVQRERVYFTFLERGIDDCDPRPAARNSGGSLLLEPQGDGTWQALIPKKRLEEETFAGYVLLASSVDGRSPATVGLPLSSGERSTFDALDRLWLDGGPRARLVAAREAMKRRWVLGAYGALGGIASIAAFLFRVRQASREAESALQRAGAEPRVYRGDTLLGTLAVISLFFAFSLGVLWIVAR